MKRLLIVLLSFFFLAAQAQQQDVIGKKTRKKATKTKTVKPRNPNYTSPNGGMVVHEIDEKEVLDSTQKSKITAPHVNSNFNENQPALSPSNGNNSN